MCLLLVLGGEDSFLRYSSDKKQSKQSDQKVKAKKDVMMFNDWDFDDFDDYIRPDEEIMITPSTDSKYISVLYQDALNQQSDSIEKPLKRISKLGSILDSDHKSEYQKSSSFIIPKIELSLINDNQNTGRPHIYNPSDLVSVQNKENDIKHMNRVEILMMREESKSSKTQANKTDAKEQYVTFHSRRNSHAVDSELKIEDLQVPKKAVDKKSYWQIDLTSDFGGVHSQDFEWQVKIQDPESLKAAREAAKWKKAYMQETQNHKLTKTVLDQALALSMKLLNEVRTLDVKLYQEKEKNKRIINQVSEEKLKSIKETGDHSNETPLKHTSEEESGSSYFIRKSTEEIENIIRKIQFDSEKKNSSEKPPQAPKSNKNN